MKRKLSFLTVCLLMVANIFLYPLSVSASTNEEAVSGKNISEGVKNFKKVVTGSEIKYRADVSVKKSTETTNEKGETEYCKEVEIRNYFFIARTDDYIASNVLNVCFKYNNNTAKIEKGGITTTPNYNDKHWKTSSSEEVYTSLQQCIASQKIDVYNRKNHQDDWCDKDEFHIDIICSHTGDIKFNISFLGKEHDIKITPIFEGHKKIKRGLKRYVIERNKEYKCDLKDDTKDKYRYITREMNIQYMDEDDDLLVDALVQANFRYNKDTNEVQCLSTSYKKQFGKLKMSMRTGNETRTYGGAYGEIKLNYLSGCTVAEYGESIIIKCDSKGNIISQII